MLNEKEKSELKKKNLELINEWVKEYCEDDFRCMVEHAFRYNGKAEISLISDGFEGSENTPKSDVQVLFRKDTEQPWEHLIIIKSGNVLSDRMECRKLESIDVLRELAQCGIIELHEEKIES